MKGVNSITKNGSIYYYARIDGKKVYCGIGDEGKELAELSRQRYEQDRKLDKMESLHFREQAQHYRKQIEQERAYKNIKELANWYMNLSTTQAKDSYLRETQALAHLLLYFGKMPVANLRGSDTVKYRDKRTEQGANDNTVDYELAVLRQIYRMAVKLDEITADCLPGQFVMNGKVNPRPVITDEQFEILHKNATPVFKDILLCGYESAMRSSEIANLRAKNVHLDVATDMEGNSVSYVNLGIFDTKNKTERIVPVSDALKEMLQKKLDGLNPDDRVFIREDGKPFNANSISDRMRTLCRQVGIPYGDKVVDEDGYRVGIVFHCLRHTRTSKWVEMGFSDEIVRKATGHLSLDAYRRYVKLNPSTVMRLVRSEKRIIRDNAEIKEAISLCKL